MKNKRKVGIAYNFGYELQLEERLRLIAESEFDSVMFLWGRDLDTSEKRREGYLCALKYGLDTELLHLPYTRSNDIWQKDDDGYENQMTALIEEASGYGIKKAVLHLSRSIFLPELIPQGFLRLRRILERGRTLGIEVVFENLKRLEPLNSAIIELSDLTPSVCLDTGHNNCYKYKVNAIKAYSDRISCVHLHDNCGAEDDHLLPFDGTINWNDRMKDLAASNFDGMFMLETDFCRQFTHNYNGILPEDFLREARKRAVRLISMFDSYK